MGDPIFIHEHELQLGDLIVITNPNFFDVNRPLIFLGFKHEHGRCQCATPYRHLGYGMGAGYNRCITFWVARPDYEPRDYGSPAAGRVLMRFSETVEVDP